LVNRKPPPDLGGTLKENQNGKYKKTPITIDNVEYQFEDMTQEQQALVNHVADLDRKLGSARFNVDQLQVGRNAFMNMLTESLKEQPSEVTEPAENAA
jgi:hypothetical protein